MDSIPSERGIDNHIRCCLHIVWCSCFGDIGCFMLWDFYRDQIDVVENVAFCHFSVGNDGHRQKMTYWFKKLHLAMGEDRRNRYQDFFSLFYVYCFHLEGQSGNQFPIWEVSWHEAKLNTGLRLLRHTLWIMIEIGPSDNKQVGW